PGDVEWVALIGALFAEARREKVSLSLDDQLYLCEHLWSVSEATPQAAEAYHHLQTTFPKAVRPEYAWLYCRAIEQHQSAVEHTLELFERAFADPEAARAFFSQKQWDWDAVELAYLEQAAALEPGHFPAALGADYPARGECVLLQRSREQEATGDTE